MEVQEDLERAVCLTDRYVGTGNNSLMIDRVNEVLESKIVSVHAYHESNMRSTKMGETIPGYY